MYEDMDRLFMLRVALRGKAYGGHVLAVTAWDGNHTGELGHQRIDVRARLIWTENGRRRTRTIWKRGQTWCAVNSSTSLDGDDAKELVLSLLAMKPGDTDEEYFTSYTKAQIAFAEEYGDDITCEAMHRYGER